MTQPLEGIRVLDLSRVLAGPYCAAMLGDMGADVIKIEIPKRGDDSRHFFPYRNGESGYYMFLNRNKKGITLNLKSDQGLEIFKELVKKADVVVENFKPGVMDRMGIGYEELRKINERIIFASISGFGQFGPYAQKPAYDIVIQAMSGLMSITGFPDGPPIRVGASVGDVVTGIMTAYGITNALLAREKTGRGQMVDVGMMDTIFSLLENRCMEYTVSGIHPKRVGSRHPAGGPFDAFRAKDDYVIIAVANDPLFVKLTKAMGMPELLEDERFLTNDLRNDYEPEMKKIIEDWAANYTVKEIVEILEKASVPCAPVYSIPDAVEDENIAAREMIVEVDHPVAGKVRMAGVPVKLSETPGSIRTAPPTLGQHNTDILRDILGYSAQKINELSKKGVI